MLRAPTSYRRIAAHLGRGGLIAYPTESCYGLGCDPDNRIAVQRLLRIKQRPQRKGLILIAASYHQIARYLQPITPAQNCRGAGRHLPDAGPAFRAALAARQTRHPRSATDSAPAGQATLQGLKQRAGFHQRQPQRATSCQNLCAMPAFVRAQGVGAAGTRRQIPETLNHHHVG